MHPRPIYRWKSFWFGMVFFAFSGWASWHSTKIRPVLRVGWGSGSYYIMRVDRQTIFLEASPTSDLLHFDWRERQESSSPDEIKRNWAADGYRTASFGDALPVSIFAFLWLGCLALKWRRQRQAPLTPP